MIFEDPSQERAAVREVFLDYLDLDPDLRDTLSKLGIRTVGAFLSLPAGGLHERFGPKAYRLYRMASGDLWEPLQPCISEEPVRQKFLLDDPESDITRLLFLIKRLLRPMLVTLADRSEALAELILRFLIYRVGWREEQIRSAAPTLDSVQVLDLVRLRLAAMKFSAGRSSPRASRPASWFPRTGKPSSWPASAATTTARTCNSLPQDSAD